MCAWDLSGAVWRQSGCAALSGHIAGFLVANPEATNERVVEWLREHARYRGPERRIGP